jgi:DNA-binding CsgD family transcriptional regulator
MQGMLLELERDLAGVVTLEDMSATVLDKLQALTGASGAGLFSFDQLGAVSIRGGSLASEMSNYTPDLFPEDALQQWSLRLPPGMFISDGSHPEGKRFDIAAHLRSRPYADFYRPLDIAFVMGVWPTGKAYGSPDMFGLILTKPHPFEPFAAETVRQVRHLETPFRLAARRIARFNALEHRADVLAQLPGCKSGSLALWDPEGRLVWASAQAQRHLESKLRRGDLDQAARAAALQLSRRNGTGEALLGRPRLLRSGMGPPMRVAFSCITASDGRPWLLAEIQVAAASSPLEDLTPAETRVLHLLARGLSNAEIGEQLRISRETVKTHLKRVFFKLGVSSRAKAMHFVARRSQSSSRQS